MLALLATSFQEPGKVSLYNLVLFIHILAAVTAFGVIFAYPIIFSVLRHSHPRALPGYHRAQEAVGKYLITSSAVVILLAGLYLASAGPFDFGDPFVGVGLVVILTILGLGGAFFAKQDARAADLAERDVAAAPPGDVEMSAEYDAVAERIMRVGYFAIVLVLVAIFMMVTKLGT